MITTNGDSISDPLTLLHDSIAKSTNPIPTNTADASSITEAVELPLATHLLFNTQAPGESIDHVSIDLAASTRFVSQRSNAPLDLLSVYFCWLNKDIGVGDYISATQALNEKRTASGLGNVSNIPFAEKLDLCSWLAGESAESEFIKRLDDNADTRRQAQGAADIASGADDVLMGDAGQQVGSGRAGPGEEERMKEIYASERSLGDRNTVLRGIKPTDFSHVRKYTASFLSRTSARPTGPTPVTSTTALRPNSKPSSRRPEQPIILLSPSASSLLRLSNIRTFLNDGTYTSAEGANTGANIIHITRTLPSIDGSRPLRFILVESPDQFKPDYWSRVVAVFTTGQAWQFKGYKWQQPAELFSHALGVYVGWKGETLPDSVKGWGRGVLSAQVDKFREGQTASQRWRDREVVEEIWSAIEGSMRSKGWGKEAR